MAIYLIVGLVSVAIGPRMFSNSVHEKYFKYQQKYSETVHFANITNIIDAGYDDLLFYMCINGEITSRPDIDSSYVPVAEIHNKRWTRIKKSTQKFTVSILKARFRYYQTDSRWKYKPYYSKRWIRSPVIQADCEIFETLQTKIDIVSLESGAINRWVEQNNPARDVIVNSPNSSRYLDVYPDEFGQIEFTIEVMGKSTDGDTAMGVLLMPLALVGDVVTGPFQLVFWILVLSGLGH